MDLSQALDIVYNGNTVSGVYLGQQLIWPSTPPVHDYSQDYLTFTATDTGALKFICVPPATAKTISYRINNGSWNSITSTGTSSTAQDINYVIGDVIEFKGNNTAYGADEGENFGRNYFFTTNENEGAFIVSGNIMSLVYGDNFVGQTTLTGRCNFSGLFQYSKIIDASNLILPATTLTDYCYYNMFDSCSSLTTAPELPATTLAEGCYAGMFNSCSSLTTAPELPATTLTDYCYYNMFNSCSSLTTAPELPATTLGKYCYHYMFSRCTSLTTAQEELPATILTEGCYQWMFDSCSSLTTAPELPATTLVYRCYRYMFQGCDNLQSIVCLATNISASDCTYLWTNLLSSTGTFTKAASMNDWTTGTSGIPPGWTVQNAS